jgi:hypothetical protein
MDNFEQYIRHEILRGAYIGLLQKVRLDFYENSVRLHGEKKVDEIMDALRDMLSSPLLTDEEKFKEFMGTYSEYEKQRRMMDLVVDGYNDGGWDN